ncbi:MAG TPA: hypothetical protein PK997_04435 [Candidatus Omnitrophota bacterium]|jgi:hypothetical protein|nr:MAG: hypothetical protein BWY49_01114 [Candidatus Omnitrophica bacterium ADurb.Bin314]HOE68657.1 hypothetical protein [Candidatus Omnitrophota bacterium]HPW64605.1 hypothetical protein [Candidatus Omnitrophota bacterium]HQB94442.1 hypothetical protein [Candidatus Omnitrophota bacterium]
MMKKILTCIKYAVIVTAIHSLGVSAIAFAEDVPWTDRFMNEFKEIKERIASLEKQQKEILAKEDEILEEIARVRVWARR